MHSDYPKCYKVKHDQAPPYVAELCKAVNTLQSRARLRSATEGWRLNLAKGICSSWTRRMQRTAPGLSVQSAPSISSFKATLKKHFFYGMLRLAELLTPNNYLGLFIPDCPYHMLRWTYTSPFGQLYCMYYILSIIPRGGNVTCPFGTGWKIRVLGVDVR